MSGLPALVIPNRASTVGPATPRSIQLRDILTSNAISGYIQHIQLTVPISFMRRFCVLTNRRLYLFESSAEDETLVETMRLDFRSRVISMVKLDATLPLAFEVLGSGSGGAVVSWILAAPSKTSKDAWMDTFTKAVDEARSSRDLDVIYSAVSGAGPASARDLNSSPALDSMRPVRMERQSSKSAQQSRRQSNNADLHGASVDLPREQHSGNNRGSGNHNRFSSGTTATTSSSSMPSPSPVSQTAASFFETATPRKDVGIRGGGAFGGAIDSDSENEGDTRGMRRFLAKVSLGSAGSSGGIEPKRSKSASRLFKGFR